MKKFISVILMMGLLMAVSCTAWADGAESGGSCGG